MYRFIWMPLGLKNVPVKLQREIKVVLASLKRKFSLVYLYDVFSLLELRGGPHMSCLISFDAFYRHSCFFEDEYVIFLPKTNQLSRSFHHSRLACSLHIARGIPYFAVNVQ